MSSYSSYSSYAVADADAEDRVHFIRRTYLHLAGAVAAFVCLEYMLYDSPLANDFNQFVFNNGNGGWLGVLGGFMVGSWLARGLVLGASRATQYAGLALFTLLHVLIFMPLLKFAVAFSSPVVLPNAAILTAIVFLSLTLVALTPYRDFSFLGTFLTLGGCVALGLIVCGALFGFDLGLAFSGGMVVLACASILFSTSRVMNRFSTDQYVAAALELFASLMLLFWYILRILIRLQRR